MGLDIEFQEASAPAEWERKGLKDLAEEAIQAALRSGFNRISFGTGGSLRGREAELDALCADLRKKYPGLKEIAPKIGHPGGVAFLNRKPGRISRLIHTLLPNDI